MKRRWRQWERNWSLFRSLMEWTYVSSTTTRDWDTGLETLRIELWRTKP